jgi:hypothetical protein
MPVGKSKEKNMLNFFWHPESQWRKESDRVLDPVPVLDPDPLVRGTYPRIRIRTKMSRIPNTGLFRELCYLCTELIHLFSVAGLLSGAGV